MITILCKQKLPCIHRSGLSATRALQTLSELASKHPNVDFLRSERERLKNSPTGILNHLSREETVKGDNDKKIRKVLEENLWKFIPIIDLRKITTEIRPKDFHADSRPEMFFVSKKRESILFNFLHTKVANSCGEGLSIAGANGTGKSELLLCMASFCFAADRPVLYVPDIEEWLKASKWGKGPTSGSGGAAYLMRQFIELNVDLIADGKIEIYPEFANLLGKIMQEEALYELDAHSKQLDLFSLIGERKGALFIDDHHKLFKPNAINGDNPHQKIPAMSYYFDQFTSWMDSAGYALPVYCGNDHEDLYTLVDTGLERLVSRIGHSSHEEMGILLGTHIAKDGEIVMRSKIPQNDELDSPLALPLASIDWGESTKSDGEKIREVYIMMTKTCGGVIRLARDITFSIKKLVAESSTIKISDVRAIILRNGSQLTEELVYRLKTLIKIRPNTFRINTEEFLRVGALSGPGVPLRINPIYEGDLEYGNWHSRYLLNEPAHRAVVNVHQEMNSILSDTPNESVVQNNTLVSFKAIPFDDPKKLLEIEYCITSKSHFYGDSIPYQEPVYRVHKGFLDQEEEEGKQGWLFVSKACCFISNVVFCEGIEEPPLLIFQSKVNDIDIEMRNRFHKPYLTINKIIEPFSALQPHTDKHDPPNVSFGEGLGRAILRDPSFTLFFNLHDNIDMPPLRIDPNKNILEQLKKQPPGFWAYSSKYPNLRVYYCYVSEIKNQKYNRAFDKLHNVLLVEKDEWPHNDK